MYISLHPLSREKEIVNVEMVKFSLTSKNIFEKKLRKYLVVKNKWLTFASAFASKLKALQKATVL